MQIPDKDEIVGMVLALEELAEAERMGPRGLQFMCHAAAKLIRRMRPDIAFTEPA